jgi:GNAT superfamily N-acetyltransferase
MATPEPTSSSEFDNPIWHSLLGPLHRFAESHGDTRWFPSDIAPFIAVPTADTLPELDAAAARGWRDPAYFFGVIPHTLPDGWHFASISNVLQLLPPSDPPRDPQTDTDEDIRELGEADRPAMLALTRIAFPVFFRERTAELGQYLGIFWEDRLMAMAGERLAVAGWQEISGVCTHPDFAGRGSARRLMRALLARHRQRGVATFLHVSEENLHARRLYDSMGYVLRASLPMGKVERATNLNSRQPNGQRMDTHEGS